jgi:hypothetical protein
MTSRRSRSATAVSCSACCVLTQGFVSRGEVEQAMNAVARRRHPWFLPAVRVTTACHILGTRSGVSDSWVTASVLHGGKGGCSVVLVVKTRSARRRGVVRLSTVILGSVDAIRRHRCSRCVASSIPPLASASFFCVRQCEGCGTARARCERLLGPAARRRLGVLRALERCGAPQARHGAGLRAAWWRRLGKVERVRALGIFMPRSSLVLGRRRRTTKMVLRLGEATWRASNRASASVRDQGDALGARAVAGVRASSSARSSPSHQCAHTPRVPCTASGAR